MEGVKTVKRFLGNYPKQRVETKVNKTFLAVILALNSFIFNSTIYLQTKGCATGTICASLYANIFMDHFENKFINPFEGISSKVSS